MDLSVLAQIRLSVLLFTCCFVRIGNLRRALNASSSMAGIIFIISICRYIFTQCISSFDSLSFCSLCISSLKDIDCLACFYVIDCIISLSNTHQRKTSFLIATAFISMFNPFQEIYMGICDVRLMIKIFYVAITSHSELNIPCYISLFPR